MPSSRAALPRLRASWRPAEDPAAYAARLAEPRALSVHLRDRRRLQRLQPQRRGEVVAGLGGVAELVPRLAAVAEIRRVIGLQFDGAVEVAHGFPVVLLGAPDGAAVVVKLRLSGLQADGLAEIFQSGVEIALLAVGVAA